MQKKLFTWIVILFVILSIYSINIMTFTLADLVLVLSTFFFVLDILLNNRKIVVHKGLIFLSFIIILHMLLVLLLDKNDSLEIAPPTLRFVSYLVYIGLFSREYFDLKYGIEIFKKVVIISTVYLIIQYILMKYFNHYLSGFIPFLPLENEFLHRLSERYYVIGNLSRPRSFFQEPAHYASFVVLYLGIILFDNRKTSVLIVTLIVLGLIISGSLTGIFTTIIIFIIYIVKKNKNFFISKLSFKKIFLIVVGVLALIIVTQTPAFQHLYYRIFVSDAAYTGRFNSFYTILEYNSERDLAWLLTGRGMFRLEGYAPGIVRIFYYFGIFGLLFFIFYNTYDLFRKRDSNWIALIILLISTIGTEIILGKFIVLYLPFILNKRSIDNNYYNEH